MKHILGISMGDPAGIGAEIAVKALGHAHIYEQCIPVILGDGAAMQDALRFTNSRLELRRIEAPEQAQGQPGVIDLIDMRLLQPGGWEYKKPSAVCGEASFQYVAEAIRLAMEKRIDAIVTGPINKESINMAGHHYAGHTEILGDLTGAKDFAMLLASKSLRVIHVTTHVSMLHACSLITTERVGKVIRLAQEGMRLLGFAAPKIGVAGFNAHCSENGLFGEEEARAIIPAIQQARLEGLDVEGPVPPDTVFVKAMAGQYDIVVAMYHDQGHIPLKLSGFQLDLKTNQYTSMSGINCTIGLPIIRASVDHGTAYGKAGEGRANEESLLDAIEAAATMADNWGHVYNA